MQAEIWRIIPSLPGVLASSHGRIMIAPYLGILPNGGTRQYGGRARTGQWDGVRFIFTWQGHSYKVAKLVCEAFNGPRPFPDAVCMHKDENSRNNVPTNLEWGTQKQNLNAPGFIEYCHSRTGDNSTFTKRKRKLDAA
jgi:hypothetical protein